MARLFVPLDVEFSTDDKILAAGPLAAYLYICSLTFCKRNDKDGVITREQLIGLAPNLTGKPKLADKLVEVGLWQKTRIGWTIPAWVKHNKSSEELAFKKEQKRLAAVKANHDRHHHDKRSATCDYCDPIEPPNRRQIGSDSEPTRIPQGKGEGREGKGEGREGTSEGEGASEAVPLPTAVALWRGKPPKDEDLWEALAHELGAANTSAEKDNRGRTRKELSALGAKPPDVHARCAEYRKRYPNAALTDAALMRHWSQLAEAKVVIPRQNPSTEAFLRVANQLGVTGT